MNNNSRKRKDYLGKHILDWVLEGYTPQNVKEGDISFLYERCSKTLKEMAEERGVSSERIRQREWVILRKIFWGVGAFLQNRNELMEYYRKNLKKGFFE